MRSALKWIALAVALGLVTGCWFWWRSDGDLFADETPDSGFHFTYRNGEEADLFTILESLGGGGALLDYDQDGLLDIFVTGGGEFVDKKQMRGLPNRLFKNLGGWRFRDVTAEVGLPTAGDALFYSNGCAAGDFNNDGWPDLLVTGYGRMTLYQNQQGKFVDVTESAGLRDQRPIHWSTSAVWADFNGDGWPDLFVCHYCDWSFANHPECKTRPPDKRRDVCPPENFKPLLPALYLNQGNGVFKETTAHSGMSAGHGLGAIAFDANNDGKLDLYVANDGTGNYLYLNQGDGKFEEAGVTRGVTYNAQAATDGSMGVAAGDYDRSGYLSLFVTNFQNQRHALLRNLGTGFFQHSENAAELSVLGTADVGFGVGFFDFDLDGAEDVFFTQGHVVRFPTPPSTFKQRPVLLHNLHKPGDKARATRFEVVSARGGPYFRTDHMGRGVAFGDLDNDGAVDIVVSHINEPATLLRNIVPRRGHWLGVTLIGKTYRDAIGAQLTLEVAGQKLTRHVLGGGSYLSSSDRRLIFGLGQARAAQQLTVRWPSGLIQRFDGADLPHDGYCTLTEGEPTITKR